MLKRLALGAMLVAAFTLGTLLPIGVEAQGPYTAQVQRALASFGFTSPGVLAIDTLTVTDATINGTCTGTCGSYQITLGWAGDRATGHAPADSTTYYFGSFSHADPATSSGSNLQPVVIPGTITAAYVAIATLGTLGSAETFTVNLRLNDTSDVALTAAATMDAVRTEFSVTGLSQAIVAGDDLGIKFTTPAWVTNPTAASYLVVLRVDI